MYECPICFTVEKYFKKLVFFSQNDFLIFLNLFDELIQKNKKYIYYFNAFLNKKTFYDIIISN